MRICFYSVQKSAFLALLILAVSGRSVSAEAPRDSFQNCFRKFINKKILTKKVALGSFAGAVVLHFGGGALLNKSAKDVKFPVPPPAPSPKEDDSEMEIEVTPNDETSEDKPTTADQGSLSATLNSAKKKEEKKLEIKKSEPTPVASKKAEIDEEVKKVFAPTKTNPPPSKEASGPAKVRSASELVDVYKNIEHNYNLSGIRPKELNAKLIFETEVSQYNAQRAKNPKLGLPISQSQYDKFLNEWDSKVQDYLALAKKTPGKTDDKIQKVFTTFFSDKLTEYMSNKAMSIHCMMMVDCNCKGKALAGYALAMDLEDKGNLVPSDGQKPGFFYPQEHMEMVFYKPPTEKQKPFSEIPIWKVVRGTSNNHMIKTSKDGMLFDASVISLLYEGFQEKGGLDSQENFNNMNDHWVAGAPPGKTYTPLQDKALKNWTSYETAFSDPRWDPSLIAKNEDDSKKDTNEEEDDDGVKISTEQSGENAASESKKNIPDYKFEFAIAPLTNNPDPLPFYIVSSSKDYYIRQILFKNSNVLEQVKKISDIKAQIKFLQEIYLQAATDWEVQNIEKLKALTLKLQNPYEFISTSTKKDWDDLSNLTTVFSRQYINNEDLEVLFKLNEAKLKIFNKKRIHANPVLEDFQNTSDSFFNIVNENPKAFEKLLLNSSPERFKEFFDFNRPTYKNLFTSDAWESFLIEPQAVEKGDLNGSQTQTHTQTLDNRKKQGGTIDLLLIKDQKNLFIDHEKYKKLFKICGIPKPFDSNMKNILCNPFYNSWTESLSQAMAKRCTTGNNSKECLLFPHDFHFGNPARIDESFDDKYVWTFIQKHQAEAILELLKEWHENIDKNHLREKYLKEDPNHPMLSYLDKCENFNLNANSKPNNEKQKKENCDRFIETLQNALQKTPDKVRFNFEIMKQKPKAGSNEISTVTNLEIFKMLAKKRGLDSRIFDRADKRSFSFVYRPQETFTSGSPVTEGDRNPKNEKQTNVTITPHSIQMTTVTQLQWYLVMGGNPSASVEFEKDYFLTTEKLKSTRLNINHPVGYISVAQAKEYVSKLTRLEQQQKGKEGCFYQIPACYWLEAAIRAGTKTAYFFGESANGDGDGNHQLTDYAWFKENSKHRLHAVAEKDPNPAGLFDMIGNVYQLCGDGSTVYGGSWKEAATELRSAAHGELDAKTIEEGADDIGLRLVHVCPEDYK